MAGQRSRVACRAFFTGSAPAKAPSLIRADLAGTACPCVLAKAPASGQAFLRAQVACLWPYDDGISSHVLSSSTLPPQVPSTSLVPPFCL
jgi:hypothetical protein